MDQSEFGDPYLATVVNGLPDLTETLKVANDRADIERVDTDFLQAIIGRTVAAEICAAIKANDVAELGRLCMRAYNDYMHWEYAACDDEPVARGLLVREGP